MTTTNAQARVVVSDERVRLRCTSSSSWRRWPLAFAGLLAACGGEAEGAGGAPEARLTSVATPALDVERYDVSGEFDWSQRRLYASLTLTLSAAQAPPSQVVLDSRVAAITAVRLVSGEALPFTVDAEGGTLTVELGAQASPGVAFVVDYEASTPFGSGTFGSTPLSVFGPREGDPSQARVAYTRPRREPGCRATTTRPIGRSSRSNCTSGRATISSPTAIVCATRPAARAEGE
jgi:hypothetical protein